MPRPVSETHLWPNMKGGPGKGGGLQKRLGHQPRCRVSAALATRHGTPGRPSQAGRQVGPLAGFQCPSTGPHSRTSPYPPPLPAFPLRGADADPSTCPPWGSVCSALTIFPVLVPACIWHLCVWQFQYLHVQRERERSNFSTYNMVKGR